MRLDLAKESCKLRKDQRAVRSARAGIGEIELHGWRQRLFVTRHGRDEQRRLIGGKAANVKMVQCTEPDACLLHSLKIGLKLTVTAPRAFDSGYICKINTGRAKLGPFRLAIGFADHNALHGIFVA